MKRIIRTSLGLFMLMLLCAAQAIAAEKATFIVVPFAVEGPQGFAYLERSVPQMLTSRLYWKDNVEPAGADTATGAPVRDAATAEAKRKAAGADYVVWGTVNAVGQDCTLDVRVKSKSGKTWQYASEAKANQLMAAIKTTSDRINKEVFNRKAEPAGGATASRPNASGRVNQMNPNLVINETTPKEVYLNPHFRYAGGGASDDTSLRSQALPFAASGMEIIDADGDGRNEVFLLDDAMLYAFHFEGGQLKPAGQQPLPKVLDILSIRGLPISGNRAELIINAIDKDTLPQAMIFSYANGQFTEKAKNVKYFLNVVNMPPAFQPVLLGQQAQPPKLFRPGIYEMTRTAGGVTPGNRLNLPESVNVLNFTYLPGGFDEHGGNKLVVLTEREHLRLYTAKGSRIAETEESYSGTSKGFLIENAMPGMGRETVTLKDMFYVPMRMLALDLEGSGKFELLVNKPISTASKIFDRYRFFPQSEIHSLFWDGIGMNLRWKTRRIKGSIVDFTVADANNDGILDLVTLINTHPGALGVNARKTIVQLFPLDLSKTNPKTQPDKTFNEQDAEY